MDTPFATQVFRRLFSRPARNCIRAKQPQGRALGLTRPQRHYASRASQKEDDGSGNSNWQQRIHAFPRDVSKQLREYPRVSSNELKSRTQRPKRVKMYTRDFIEGTCCFQGDTTAGTADSFSDSLYNPFYGYFSQHATIFNSHRPFDFNAIKDEAEFNRLVDKSYVEFEDALDEEEPDETRQLWHTPTELFRPHYGEAIARYLVTNYKMTLFPYHDLVIYEMGAGNGTMMQNILDYIRDTDPEVYARTRFKVIEISNQLSRLQKQKAFEHLDRIEIVNRSIFDWKEYVNSPCFFLALEVIDNFGHDAIRYDPETEVPLQGSVLIDENGEMFDFYERNLDPIVSRYLNVRDTVARAPFRTPISGPKFLRTLRHSLPLAPNLTVPEYLPTRLMQFFDILSQYFPAHRLVLSDFNHLPSSDTVAGLNAPVVQTRYQRRNVQVTTPFVHQGYFDIFFPTDFQLMEDMYRALTGKLTRVSTHESFLRSWADVEATATVSGENPLLSWYKNASMMTTV